MEESLAQNNQNGGLSEPVPYENNNMDSNETVNQESSEFAEKKPLINQKSKRKLIKGSIGCVIVILLIIIGASVYKAISSQPLITRPVQVCDDGTPPPCEPEPIQETETDQPKIGYIKNEKEVWIVDIDGQNKEKIKEIPQAVNQIYSDLDWKNITSLTYSQCTPSSGRCSIETIDIKTKAVETEENTNGYVKKFVWSNDEKYLAYVENANKEISFKLKAGTIVSNLATVPFGNDKNDINTDVLFSDNNNYVIYSTIKKDSISGTIEYPVIEIYQINGVKVDEIKDAEFPMYKSDNIIVYKTNDEIVFRTIGKNDQSYVTRLKGQNPQLSPDETDIAYWLFDETQNNVDIGIYDSDLDFHKNILRGVVKPEWISQDELIGIQVNCQSGSCELYEFQTNNLVIVDIVIDSVETIDQAKKISGITYFDKLYDNLEND